MTKTYSDFDNGIRTSECHMDHDHYRPTVYVPGAADRTELQLAKVRDVDGSHTLTYGILRAGMIAGFVGVLIGLALVCVFVAFTGSSVDLVVAGSLFALAFVIATVVTIKENRDIPTILARTIRQYKINRTDVSMVPVFELRDERLRALRNTLGYNSWTEVGEALKTGDEYGRLIDDRLQTYLTDAGTVYGDMFAAAEGDYKQAIETERARIAQDAADDIEEQLEKIRQERAKADKAAAEAANHAVKSTLAAKLVA